jgi:hypothetical protein
VVPHSLVISVMKYSKVLGSTFNQHNSVARAHYADDIMTSHQAITRMI